MDMTEKKTILETLIRAATEQAGFNGAWLYAEGGEIVMKDGALYAEAADGERACTLRLWPLDESRFGIKDLDADLTFADGTLTLYGVTGKKTE